MSLSSHVTMLRIALPVAATTVACGGGNASPPVLVTAAEQSGTTRTGRYDEVESSAPRSSRPTRSGALHRVRHARRKAGRCWRWSSRADGALDAAAARAQGLPVS